MIPANSLKTQSPSIGGIPKERRADYRAWRDEVALELHEHGFLDEAERWDYCDNSPRYKINRSQPELPPSAETVWVCSASSDHDAVLFSTSCDYRICPDCAHRHTARLMNRYIPVIEKLIKKHPQYRLRTITLTRTNELGQVGFKEAAQNGFDLIQKLMNSVVGPKWNKDGAGLLANWEVGPKGHKLHYHMVYFGMWVDWEKLRDTWHELTGDSYRVWVSAVKHNDSDWQGAVMETLKYATKFYSEDKATGKRKYLSPALTVELFKAMKNTRRIRSWGSLYNIDVDKERVFCCEQCKAKMVRIGVGYFQIWRETGFTPEGWRAAIRETLLTLRIANKSPPENAKTDNTNRPQANMLPVFDKIPIKGISHYDAD